MEEQQEQERAKVNAEENDETKVQFVPKEDEKKKDKEKEKKKASLLRAMAYQFGPQFMIGMLLKLLYDVIQFLQPQLMK